MNVDFKINVNEQPTMANAPEKPVLIAMVGFVAAGERRVHLLLTQRQLYDISLLIRVYLI